MLFGIVDDGVLPTPEGKVLLVETEIVGEGDLLRHFI